MNLSEKTKKRIAEMAKLHIKRVTENPDVETDGDNFDYWNTTQDDQSQDLIDYNIYCGDEVYVQKQDGTGEYEYTDPSTWSWAVCAYAVDPPTKDNPYYQVNTNDYEPIEL